MTVQHKTAALTYDARQVAAMLGGSVRWVYGLALSGELPSLRLGRRVLFLRHVIDNLTQPPVPGPDDAPAELGAGAAVPADSWE